MERAHATPRVIPGHQPALRVVGTLRPPVSSDCLTTLTTRRRMNSAVDQRRTKGGTENGSGILLWPIRIGRRQIQRVHQAIEESGCIPSGGAVLSLGLWSG